MESKKSLFTENEVLISATAENVWQILIDPAMTRQYMFGCDVQCSWKVGDPIHWIGHADGITYVSGKLIAFEPYRKFSFSVFDPHGPYQDIPQNYLTATYLLSEENNQTHLTVTQGDYTAVEGGDDRYKDSISNGGWQPVIDQIKVLTESN